MARIRKKVFSEGEISEFDVEPVFRIKKNIESHED